MGDAELYEALDPRSAANFARTQRLVAGYLRRYHGHTIDGHLERPTGQVLFVANHGFGGFFDLNVLALMAYGHSIELDRPVTMLCHKIAWTLGLGPVIEPYGAKPASRDAAATGFAKGHHVLVLPGGDLDAFKAYKDRNKILFQGRSGYAKLALEAGVPIIPIVTSGAGDSLRVLSDGQRLAKTLRLDKVLRLKAVPITLSLPWGLGVGLVGLLPYIPLPSKIRTRVLPPMVPESGESAAEFARRVETAMQAALDDLSAH